MQSNPTASSVSSCWKIIGYVCERFPVLAFQGTSTIQPTEKNEFFPSTLTVTSTESGVCSRWTNTCILFTSVWSNEA